jgi:GT2 family glycosyltransferase
VTSPAVSVILPGFRSQATVARCLSALAGQAFHDFETVLVDSSPDGRTERIVAEGFPWVRYERHPHRLLPHAARNRGVELARGELLAFSDPDVYAHPAWLARLVAAQRATGGVVAGGIACFGARRLDRGIHLCKFGKWLPPRESREPQETREPRRAWEPWQAQEPRQAPARRTVDMSPTANVIVTRRDFAAAGGFPGDLLLGDVILSRRLRALGLPLWFEPGAVVAHHHLHTFGSFLGERFRRGRLYGEMRAGWWQARPLATAGMLLATALPVRWPRVLAIAARQAARADGAGAWLAALPVAAAGHAASLAGEALAYGMALAGRWAGPPLPEPERAERSGPLTAGNTKGPL